MKKLLLLGSVVILLFVGVNVETKAGYSVFNNCDLALEGNNAGSNASINFFNGVTGAWWAISHRGSSDNLEIHVRSYGSTSYATLNPYIVPQIPLVLTTSSNVSIGGNLTVTGSINQGSSRDLKKDITFVTTGEAFEALKGLNPIKYKYKADSSGEEQLGFIAEDGPELVATKDHKLLNAMDITAVLTKVVQEQQKEIQQLRNEILELKDKRYEY